MPLVFTSNSYTVRSHHRFGESLCTNACMCPATFKQHAYHFPLCLHQPKSLEHFLSQEDGRLLAHLKSSGSLAVLPYSLWFRRCFADCLPESSLQRLALISCSFSILLLIFRSFLITLDSKNVVAVGGKILKRQ